MLYFENLDFKPPKLNLKKYLNINNDIVKEVYKNVILILLIDKDRNKY